MRSTIAVFCLSLWITAASARAQIMPLNPDFAAWAPALGTMGAIAGAHLLPGWLLALGVPTYVGGTIAGSLTGVGFAAGVGGLALGAAAGVGLAIAGFYAWNWLTGKTYMNNQRAWDRHFDRGTRAETSARPATSGGVALLGTVGAAGM